jgi:hypothetical protein
VKLERSKEWWVEKARREGYALWPIELVEDFKKFSKDIDAKIDKIVQRKVEGDPDGL